MARAARSDRRRGVVELRGVRVSPHRATSATRIVFDVRMVAAITLTALGIAGAQWASSAGQRSDLRDIKTRLEMRERIDASEAKLQEDRAVQLREAIQAMRNRQEMQQLEIQDLKEMILRGDQQGKTR
jgi:hypothetical protein